MDIRKFFGPASSAAKNKNPEKKILEAGKTATETKSKNNSNSLKASKAGSTEKGKNQSKKPSTPSKKPSVVKHLQDENDSIVVEDFSDEEVIKSSLDSKQSLRKSKLKTDSSRSISEKSSKSKTSIRKNDKEKKNGSKRDAGLDSEEVIDINSSHSSSQSSKSSAKSSENPKPARQSKSRKSTDKDSSDIKENKSVEESPLRSSPRKQKSTSRKRVLSEEDVDIKPKKYSFNSDSSDTEEVISSRRSRNGKHKKSLQALDSDSDENPIPDSKPPKLKRKKKEAVSYVADSDEDEKKVTAMDKFVIHNAKTPQDAEKPKAAEPVRKATPVSVADFFGDSAASRSSRTTAVAKRKLEHEDEKKAENGTDSIELDEELHDDEDFMKTLDQLDGPDVKKVKKTDTTSSTASPPKKPEPGSLASKLAGKMKQTPANKSNSEESKKSSPIKQESSSKTSTKKGKVYTMEVTKVKPPTVVVSPGKTKKPEPMISPAKPERKKTETSATDQSAKDNDDGDDGFGGPKAIKGFQAFKQRGGPLALGSKEIPEGAENCMEGLTFVITGVLDSIDRDDAKSLIEKHGGKVTGSVSGRTSYVVVGREPGESKIKKATQLKVKQLDEDGLLDLVRTLPGKTSKYEIQAKEQMKKEASIKAQKEQAEQKQLQAAKKLESFRSEKDVRNSSASPGSTKLSPQKKQGSLFTQLKDSGDPPHGEQTTSSLISSSAAAPSPSTSAKLLSQSQSPSQRAAGGPQDAAEPQSLLWVDKHKPTTLKQIIGQQGDKSNARKLLAWLKSWHQNVIVKGLKSSGNFFNKGDGAGCRAALLSGPPGIGKTTSATLVCQELGFSYVELNASDTRSKRSLKEVVAESLDNNTLVDYTSGQGDRSSAGQSHCLIMDEVDGMAGNEDRGGLQELVQLIKKSKIPIICICNDRNSMKMRTLSNYCLDLRFQRPRVEQIKGAMMSLAFKEGLKIPPAALNEIILASNHDIRQVIHNMSVWSAGDKTMTFEQVKTDAQKAQKDIKLGPFDVCRKVFVSDDETRKMSLNEKSDLFFHDYSFGPLFVHENYTKVIPNSAGGNHSKHMSCLARTIDSICDGDLVDKLIRKEGNWNLLPTQAMYSSVIPGEVMRGAFPQMTDFPQWLGKFSSTNKTHRILQELSTHMALEVSCDKRGLTLDYLPSLRKRLTQPLVSQGSEGVPNVIKVMDDYDIIKEDFDNILEISKWPGGFDPMAKLDSKTKAAFTRQYNKEIHMTPYATGASGGKKKRARGAPMEEEGLLGEEEEGGAGPQHSDEEEEEGIDADSMIKAKKPTAAKGRGAGKETSGAAGKGKGRGKGAKK